MAQAVENQSGSGVALDRKTLTRLGYAAAVILLLLWLVPLASQFTGARMVQTTIQGLFLGGVYALVALGIVVINKASGVFNFAHGYMMLMGGFVFYSLFITHSNVNVFAVGALALATCLMLATTGGYHRLRNPLQLALTIGMTVLLTFLMTLEGAAWQPWVRASVGAVTASLLIGVAIERFTIRPLIGQPLFTAVMMTLALGELLRGLIVTIWGSLERRVPIFANSDPITETYLSWRPIRIDGSETFLDGQIIIRPDQLVAFVLAILAFVIFLLFFQFTNVGLSMRATAEDQQLAQSVGLRVRVILAVAWGIAALLATTAGILQGGANNLAVNSIPVLALAAFPAVLLGGLESITGALVGGLIIGVIQAWTALLFPGTQADTELAPYLVLMIVLVLRPDGLFGQRRIERI